MGQISTSLHHRSNITWVGGIEPQIYSEINLFSFDQTSSSLGCMFEGHMRWNVGQGRHLGAADPVALHALDAVVPVEPAEVAQQAVRILGDG